MGFYKVRPGQAVGQNGQEFHAGAVLEIPDHVVTNDLSHKVDPCDKDGNLIKQDSRYEVDLAGAAAHERISILETERTRLKDALAKVDAAIADEKKTATKAEPVKAAPPAAPVAPVAIQHEAADLDGRAEVHQAQPKVDTK